ncbi:MAG: alpha/beta hydrolase, partial [Pirellulales bacterium]|nr:alpha/beta hydrolase [Pirellulales bacterium]
MKSFFLPCLIALMLAGHVFSQDSVPAPAEVISIWPQSPPAWQPPEEQERDTSGPDSRQVAGQPVIRLGFVSRPELHLYRPAKPQADTAVVICPGGGYTILAWDLEGTEIATWL